MFAQNFLHISWQRKFLLLNFVRFIHLICLYFYPIKYSNTLTKESYIVFKDSCIYPSYLFTLPFLISSCFPFNIGVSRYSLPSLGGRGKGEGLLGRVSEQWFLFFFYLTTLKFCFAQALVQRLKCHHSVRKGMKPAALITSRRSLRLANASREIRRRATSSFSLSI